MNKNIKVIFSVFFVALLVFQTGLLKAQLSGTEAYVLGTGVQYGISGKGGYEGADTTLGAMFPGTHFRSNTQYFGFVANPQHNNWSTFDGDFFSPGTPENGWGISLGTSAGDASNNCTQLFDIPGSITSYQHVFDCIIVDWEGTDAVGTNLDIKIEYLLEQTDLFYTTTISIKNNTTATIPTLYYYRNLDPDNNIMINGSNYATLNTVVSQPGTGGCDIAHVSATQSNPWDSYVGFAAAGANWRASYGGFSNRDGSAIWNGTGFTQTAGSSDSNDIAIQLSYLVQNLAAGATTTFKYVTILADTAANRAINNLMYFTYPGSSGQPPAACTPYLDTVTSCGPVQININGSAANEYTWTWSPTAGLSASTGDSVIATPTGTTTYTVTGSPLVGCLAPVSYSIVVKEDPSAGLTPTITGALSFCTGGSSTLDAGAGYTSYLWSTAATTETIPVTTGGTYTVTVTNAAGCAGTASATVIVNANLTPTITGLPAICVGNTDTLDAGAGYTSYLWSTSATTETILVTTTGTYTVTVTNASSCSGTASATVTVNSNLTPVITGPTSICTGTTGTLDAGAGYSTYLWSTAANTETITVNTPGTYNVTVTNASGCSGSASLVETVGVLTVSVTSTEEHCGHSDGTAQVDTSACSSYLWSTVPAQTTQTATNISAGLYTVTVTCGGCTATASATVIDAPGPSASFANVLNSLCGLPNGSATVIPTGGTPNYTFAWNSTPPQTTQIMHGVPAGNYDVTVTDFYGCTATNEVTILSFPSPTDTILTIVGAKCNKSDGALTVTVNGGTRPFLYVWDTHPPQSDSTALNIPAGSYDVTVTDANGCHATATAVVPTTNAPSDTIAEKDEYCGEGNGRATVTATGGSGGYSYLWNNGEAAAADTNLSAGIFTVTVTDDSNCAITATISVANLPGPTASFFEQPKILTLLDGPVTFTDNSTSTGGTIISWSWCFGDGNVGCGTYFQHQYTNIGTYVVTLIVKDNHGCADTINDTVKVKDYYTFYVPNAFTPNGDGLNDYFQPTGNNVDPNNFSMVIYDRWGNLVFQTNKWYIKHDDEGYAEGWKGTLNNTGSWGNVVMDVYVYRIKLTDLNGIKHEYYGKITTVP